MKILSHRGYWKSPEEKNTPRAFSRAFQMGFGTETDIRWRGQRLVISHDADDPSPLVFDDFLDLYTQHDTKLPLALNIKEDGLQDPIAKALEHRGIGSAFCFDMSVPDMVGYLNRGLPVFTRISDFEPEPIAIERCGGIWVDALEREWLDPDKLAALGRWNKALCFVSPELHGRDYRPFWELLRSGVSGWLCDEVLLCTDHPEEAREFFKISPLTSERTVATNAS